MAKKIYKSISYVETPLLHYLSGSAPLVREMSRAGASLSSLQDQVAQNCGCFREPKCLWIPRQFVTGSRRQRVIVAVYRAQLFCGHFVKP